MSFVALLNLKGAVMDCNTTINFNCESFKAEIYSLSLTEVGQFIIAICDQVISGKPVSLDNTPALVNLVGVDGVINWLNRMTTQKYKYIFNCELPKMQQNMYRL